jgi:hypothetical protein
MSADPTANAAIAPNTEAVLSMLISFCLYSNLAAGLAAQSMTAK